MDLDLSSLNEREGEVRPVLPQLRLVAGDVEAGRCPQEVGMEVCQRIFTPTRLELKGWGDWDDERGAAIDMGEVGSILASLKASVTMELQGRFDWEATEQEHRNFELTMMVCLWFRVGVSAWDRKRSPTILAKEMSEVMRSGLLQKSCLRKDICLGAQAIWLGTMAKFRWRRDLFDIKWLTNGLRVSGKGPPAGQRLTLLLPATLSQGSKWWMDELCSKKKNTENPTSIGSLSRVIWRRRDAEGTRRKPQITFDVAPLHDPCHS